MYKVLHAPIHSKQSFIVRVTPDCSVSNVPHPSPTSVELNDVQYMHSSLCTICCNFSLASKFITQPLDGNFFHITLNVQFQI